MKKFSRTIEDFNCEVCGQHNSGDGYTNHCYNCLWSKHVDVNPGDRAEKCGGLMKPEDVIFEDKKYHIKHVCQKCGMIRRKGIEKNDNFDRVIEVSKNSSKNKIH